MTKNRDKTMNRDISLKNIYIFTISPTPSRGRPNPCQQIRMIVLPEFASNFKSCVLHAELDITAIINCRSYQSTIYHFLGTVGKLPNYTPARHLITFNAFFCICPPIYGYGFLNSTSNTFIFLEILQVCTTQHQKDQALSDRACCTTSCPGPCHF